MNLTKKMQKLLSDLMKSRDEGVEVGALGVVHRRSDVVIDDSGGYGGDVHKKQRPAWIEKDLEGWEELQ